MPTRIIAIAEPPQKRVLPALLVDLFERLREPLERILVGRLGAAPRGTLYSEVAAFAHGVNHAGFLGYVLDPGAVVLRVHCKLAAADLGNCIGAGLERVAYDDRDLVLHVLGRTARYEQIGLIALSPRGLGLRQLRLSQCKSDLAATRGGGIRAPVTALTEQGRLRASGRCGRGSPGLCRRNRRGPRRL